MDNIVRQQAVKLQQRNIFNPKNIMNRSSVLVNEISAFEFHLKIKNKKDN